MGKCHHDNDLEISDQVQKKHDVYGFRHLNGDTEKPHGGKRLFGSEEK